MNNRSRMQIFHSFNNLIKNITIVYVFKNFLPDGIV